jgi:hypothetical protein
MADGLTQGVHTEFKPWVPQKKKRNYEDVCKTSQWNHHYMYSIVDWRKKTKNQHEEKMIKIMQHEVKENNIKFTKYITSV